MNVKTNFTDFKDKEEIGIWISNAIIYDWIILDAKNKTLLFGVRKNENVCFRYDIANNQRNITCDPVKDFIMDEDKTIILNCKIDQSNYSFLMNIHI